MKENKKEQDGNVELLCPIRYTLDIVGGKWKLPIICMLSAGEATRYSTIKRKLTGVTNMMLSQSLKELEAYGIILRYQYQEIPPRVEYTLTPKGQSLVPTLVQFAEWGAEQMKEDENKQRYCAECQAML